MLNNIQKLYIFSFLSNLAFFGAVSVPFFLFWGQLNYTQLFLLQVWFTVWLFLLEVPTGTIADKFGRKFSLFFSALCVSLAAFAYSQIPNFYVFMIAEVFFALGIALASGADRALIYDSLKEMKQEKNSKYFFSRFAIFETLAIAIAFPVGSVIAGSDILPYPNVLALPMMLTSIPLLLAALVSLSLKEPRRAAPKGNLLRAGLKGINYLRKHKALRSLAVDMSLVSATAFFIFWFYQPLLLNAGLDIKFLGFVSAGFNLLAAFLLLKIKYIEKSIGMKRMLFLTAVLPGLAFLGLVVFNNLLFVLPLVFIVSSLGMSRPPLFDHYMNKFIRSSNRATVLSAVSMLRRIIIALLYPVVGVLSDISVYNAVALIGILTLVFALFAKVNERHLRS